jgi:hypothetical protein
MHAALPLSFAQYAPAQGPGPGETILYLAVAGLTLAGMWKVFQKAGKPGWAALIPIYNLIVLLQITGKPIWWLILFIIPLVNVVMLVLVFIELAQRFGKSALFGIGLAFLGFVFFPILGFGDARYQGVGTMTADLRPRGAA